MDSLQRSSMRRLRILASELAGLAALLVLPQVNAWACRCPEHVPVMDYYEKAQYVVTGKVVELHANGKDGSSATVTVNRVWKADVPKTISISTRTSCAFNVNQGAEYLLYLFRTPDGGYYTSKCVGDLPLKQAESRLKWLEQHAVTASTTGP